ncbi:cysteine--tRNA ligase [Candidatus Pacearchaeota archaeon]|nr:cysteine--tRNA ligase [Candidatus Pacearchaeota archaeon]
MLKLYNTMAREKEKFVPIEDGKVGFYVCGPTMNGVPHLGHAMSQVSFDVIRRYLVFSGYDVKFVSNITDIDDKIIAGANREGISIEEFSDRNEKAHRNEYSKLGVMAPDVQPKATEYVDEMIELIGKLEEKGFAYLIGRDGVYFDISKFGGYGKLSGQVPKNLESGRRITVVEGKRNAGDFVLWKLAKEGEPFWESPWGNGRPGWHIECSAMSKEILGVPFDIHGGGADLMFPHHDGEIAQSEAGYGEKMVNYWMHNGMITVDGKKMGKSLGNFKNIEDLEFPSMAIRYFVVSNHYRRPLDFSKTALQDAKNSYERLRGLVLGLEDDGKTNDNYLDEFRKEMDDDFNGPRAMAVLWKMVRDEQATGKVGAVRKMDEVFGLKLLEREKVEVPEDVLRLAEEREAARKEKNFERSDLLRDKIKVKGFIIRDSEDGFILNEMK